ncbi:hypothetical protein GBW32_31170 [Streptomyces tsukubensis]|uniref:hypothetical protein n=1 Tax=Streptomyces tsukubensis TaxID=83656 RepID=UPI001265E67E|nr:hypothetical protein [Streptomyces tsukubensis]QFR96679.1 hypothetical protein GBW32_31170 [Streptomyces tsukubensis]
MNDAPPARITSALILPKTGGTPETAYLFQGVFAKRYTKTEHGPWQPQPASRLDCIWPQTAKTAGALAYGAAHTYNGNIWLIRGDKATSFRPDGVPAHESKTADIFSDIRDTTFRDGITAASALSDTQVFLFKGSSYLRYDTRRGQTTDIKTLPHGLTPDAACWIPDSTTPTIHLYSGTDIYTYQLDKDGTTLTPVSDHPESIFSLYADAPANRPYFTLFCCFGDAVVAWTMDYDLSTGKSSIPTKLVERTMPALGKSGNSLNVVFSPYNERLYYGTSWGDAQKLNLFSMTYDGKKLGQVKLGSEGHAITNVKCLSHDGTQIAVTVNTSTSSDFFASETWAVDTDDIDQSVTPEQRSDVLILNQSTSSFVPSLSDSMYTLDRIEEENPQLLEVSLGGRPKIRHKSPAPKNCSLQGLSPDGKWLYFRDHPKVGEIDLRRFDLRAWETGGNIQTLLTTKWNLEGMAFTPDGQMLCIVEASTVHIMDPENPAAGWQIPYEYAANEAMSGPSADPNGSYFYVPVGYKLWVVDARNRTSKPLAKLEIRQFLNGPAFTTGWTWARSASEEPRGTTDTAN